MQIATSISDLADRVKQYYLDRFGEQPLLIRAPGRINLIGEHTDYNNGFVLPAAVNQSVYLAIGKSSGGADCILRSLDFEEDFEFQLNELEPLPSGSWQNYILGVVAQIKESGHLMSGFNLVICGDIPMGSGMSSSAALECGTCFAIKELFGLDISSVEMVQMCQRAEHTYAGVKCGIMDQFASMMGKKDHALLLDCRSLKYEYFPIQLKDYSLVLCNSNVTHSLASSEYNVRRQQCEAGVEVFQQIDERVNSLRDVSMPVLETAKDKLTNEVYKRCKYVIQENLRVKLFTKALLEGNLCMAGGLLEQAQFAMKYEYEITCPEIDFLAEFANAQPEVLGSRMMGGGFGGCTINIVKKEAEEGFLHRMQELYQLAFQKEFTVIEVGIADGVGRCY